MSQPWGGSEDTGQAPGVPPLVLCSLSWQKAAQVCGLHLCLTVVGKLSIEEVKLKKCLYMGLCLYLISSKHPSAAAPL